MWNVNIITNCFKYDDYKCIIILNMNTSEALDEQFFATLKKCQKNNESRMDLNLDVLDSS